MEKNMETAIMGCIGFRFQGLGPTPGVQQNDQKPIENKKARKP